MNVVVTDKVQQAVANVSDFAKTMNSLLKQPLPDFVSEEIVIKWIEFLRGSADNLLKGESLQDKSEALKNIQKKVLHFRDKNSEFLSPEEYSWITDYGQNLQIPSDAYRAISMMSELSFRQKRIVGQLKYLRDGIRLLSDVCLDFLHWITPFGCLRQNKSPKIILDFDVFSNAVISDDWELKLNIENQKDKEKIRRYIKDIKRSAKSILLDLQTFKEELRLQSLYPDFSTYEYMESQSDLFEKNLSQLRNKHSGQYICFEDGKVLGSDTNRARLAEKMRALRDGKLFFIEKVPAIS